MDARGRGFRETCFDFLATDTSGSTSHLQTYARYHVVVIFRLLCDEFFDLPREVLWARFPPLSRVQASFLPGWTGRVSRQPCL